MEIIDEIKAAEKKAQKLKDDAKAAARADAEMIDAEAKKKAALIKSDAAAQAAKAEADAKAEAESITAEAKKASELECAKLKEDGMGKLKEAVGLIFKGALEI